MIINAIKGKPLPYMVMVKNIRDWLHVKDHCSAIDLVIHKGKQVKYIILVAIMKEQI